MKSTGKEAKTGLPEDREEKWAKERKNEGKHRKRKAVVKSPSCITI